MKRGRKPLAPPAEIEGVLEMADHTPPEPSRDLALLTAQDRQSQDWMKATRLVGRIEGAELSLTVGEVAIAQTFASLRESKAYVGAPYTDGDGNLRHVRDLTEFCEHFLGKSYQRCYELAKNLNTLGADLYQRAQVMGLRQRDYNALKALPADDQAVVKQALADGADRETVIDKLVSLVERQAQEKAALAKDIDDARADIKVKDERAERREREIEKKTAAIARLKRESAKAPPDKQLLALRTELVGEVVSLVGAICADDGQVTSLLTRVRALAEHGEEHGEDCATYLAGVFAYLERTLFKVRDEFHVPSMAIGDPRLEVEIQKLRDTAGEG